MNGQKKRLSRSVERPAMLVGQPVSGKEFVTLLPNGMEDCPDLKKELNDNRVLILSDLGDKRYLDISSLVGCKTNTRDAETFC